MLMSFRSLATGSVLAAAALTLSACDNKGSGTSASDAGDGKKIRIAVSVPSADHGWTAGVSWWAKQAMALYPNVEWQFYAADKPEKQISDIEDAMTKGVDGLVILATESQALTPTAKKAHDKGIFIVNVDRGFTEPAADIFIEGDNKAFGRKSAEFIVDRLSTQNGSPKGDIVILEGVPCTVNTDRVEAAMALFAKYPEIKVLGRQTSHWSRTESVNVTHDFLTKNPHLDAVWAADDDSALGALQAIKEAGREKDIWVLGGAGMKDVIKMVADRDPRVPADITYPPSMIAAGIQLAVSALRDGKQDEVKKFMPRHMVLDVDLVTPENANNYYFKDSVY